MSVFAPMELILKTVFAKQLDVMGARFGMDSLVLASKDSTGMDLCACCALTDKLGIQGQEHALVNVIMCGTEISVRKA